MWLRCPHENDGEMRGESEVPVGALNLVSTNYPDHGHHGRLPLSRKKLLLILSCVISFQCQPCIRGPTICLD